MLLVQHPPAALLPGNENDAAGRHAVLPHAYPLLAQLRSQLDQAESLSPLYFSTLVLTR